MKIAILYICTGRYNQFFEGFYTSAQSHLFGQAEKVFFVWSDNPTIAEGRNNIRYFHKECAGFPADSLFRFEMFLQAEQELAGFDYIYFFNANTLFVGDTADELLPDTSGLVAAVWPTTKRWQRLPIFYSYERNKRSLAYIKPFDGPYREFMGGLNGGTAKAYLRMIRTLAGNIRTDYDNGIIACAHDQSHINKYLHIHPCKVLPTEFALPEEWADGKAPKIIFLDKVKIDSYFNKRRKMGFRKLVQRSWHLIYRVIIWYI